MSDLPKRLKYTETHEWVRNETDGTATIGITHHAQHLLGDMLFIELPSIKNEYNSLDDMAVVESVKAATDVSSPVTGVVVEVNDALIDSPKLVNTDPYGDGWLVKLKLFDIDELKKLLTAKEYAKHITED